MKKIEINFSGIAVGSLEKGSDHHVKATVIFRLSIDGVDQGEFRAPLKGLIGSENQLADIEIGSPSDASGNRYKGEFDRDQFVAAVQAYFRANLGGFYQAGHLIISNSFFGSHAKHQFEADESSSSW